MFVGTHRESGGPLDDPAEPGAPFGGEMAAFMNANEGREQVEHDARRPLMRISLVETAVPVLDGAEEPHPGFKPLADRASRSLRLGVRHDQADRVLQGRVREVLELPAPPGAIE